MACLAGDARARFLLKTRGAAALRRYSATALLSACFKLEMETFLLGQEMNPVQTTPTSSTSSIPRLCGRIAAPYLP